MVLSLIDNGTLNCSCVCPHDQTIPPWHDIPCVESISLTKDTSFEVKTLFQTPKFAIVLLSLFQKSIITTNALHLYLSLHCFQVLNGADQQRPSRSRPSRVQVTEEQEDSSTMTATGRKTNNSNGAVPAAGQGRPGNPDENGNVTIKGTLYDSLLQSKKDLTATTKQLQATSKSRQSLNKQMEQITKSLETMNEKADLDKKTIENKDKVIEELKKKIEELTQSLRSTGKVAPCELNESLKDKVFEAAKLCAWRTVKFPQSDEDLAEITRGLIPYLPSTALSDYTEDEFVRLYLNTTNEGLKQARGYINSEGVKRAKGK